MSLIDQTYFVADLQIPNTDQKEILERLQYFIDEHEPVFLNDLLGYELYRLLLVELEAKEDDENYVYSTRFDRLINGYEYTGQDTRLHKWRGLIFKNEEENVKQSPIANYVYWHYLKDSNSQTVGLGEVKTQGQNAFLTSPVIKQNTSWNKMSRMVQELYYFMQSNRNDYPEWDNSQWYYRQRLFAPQNQFGI